MSNVPSTLAKPDRKAMVDRFVEEVRQKHDIRFRIQATEISDGSLKGQVVVQLLAVTGFRFMDLPGELRNKVYKIMFTQTEAYSGAKLALNVVFCDKTRSPKNTLRLPHEFALLYVNKLIYDEGIGIAFQNQCFEFQSARAMDMFVSKIARNSVHLTAVSFLYSAGLEKMLADAPKALGGCTNLRSIYLPTGPHYGAAVVAESRIRGEKNARAYAELLKPLLLRIQERAQSAKNDAKKDAKDAKAGAKADAKKDVKNETLDVVPVWRNKSVVTGPSKSKALGAKRDEAVFMAELRRAANEYLKEE